MTGFLVHSLMFQQYHIYLFQRILLCCKDVNPNKQKSKLIGSKDKPSANFKGKPRLQLKGRIYMANVTDVVLLQKPGMAFHSSRSTALLSLFRLLHEQK